MTSDLYGDFSQGNFTMIYEYKGIKPRLGKDVFLAPGFSPGRRGDR